MRRQTSIAPSFASSDLVLTPASRSHWAVFSPRFLRAARRRRLVSVSGITGSSIVGNAVLVSAASGKVHKKFSGTVSKPGTASAFGPPPTATNPALPGSRHAPLKPNQEIHEENRIHHQTIQAGGREGSASRNRHRRHDRHGSEGLRP